MKIEDGLQLSKLFEGVVSIHKKITQFDDELS